MNITFFDLDDQTNPLNGAVIGDNSRLFEVLNSMKGRLPVICELVGENGYCLDVGTGKVGCVQYSRCDGTPPYLVAVSRKDEQKDGYYDFQCGGTPTPVPARECMPFDEVMEVVRYFRETGDLHPGVSWEEI
jgi:hypothetical protein